MKNFSERFIEIMDKLIEYLRKDCRRVIIRQQDKIERIYKMMEYAKKLHVYGVGRSGDPASSLALRLKHFGYDVYFLGDKVKEPIEKDDLVFLFSGSGETADIITVAKRAKKAKASVIGITSFENSTLTKYSDLIFILPGGMEKKKGWDYLGAQIDKREFRKLYGFSPPLGSLFELSAYLFQEALLDTIFDHKKIPGKFVAKKHVKDEVIE